MCNYTQDASNTLDWDVKTGDDADVINRMPDHTTQSIEGNPIIVFNINIYIKYLYFNFINISLLS